MRRCEAMNSRDWSRCRQQWARPFPERLLRGFRYGAHSARTCLLRLYSARNRRRLKSMRWQVLAERTRKQNTLKRSMAHSSSRGDELSTRCRHSARPPEEHPCSRINRSTPPAARLRGALLRLIRGNRGNPRARHWSRFDIDGCHRARAKSVFSCQKRRPDLRHVRNNVGNPCQSCPGS